VSRAPKSIKRSTHSSICIVDHARQKGGFVLQVAYTKALQSCHPLHSSLAGTPRLPLHLRIDARKAKLRHVRDNNECPGEDALVSSLRPFDQLAAQYNIQASRHGASGNLIWVFLDADLLPVCELAIVEGQFPLRSVTTQRIRTQVRFGVLELLLNFGYDPPTFLAVKGPEDQLWSDFGGASDGARDGEESADALCSELTDTRNKWKVMECDVEFSGLEPGVCGGGRSGVDVEIGRVVLSDEVEEGTPEIWKESRRYINTDLGLREETAYR
jgi:hypothetical protein